MTWREWIRYQVWDYQGTGVKTLPRGRIGRYRVHLEFAHNNLWVGVFWSRHYWRNPAYPDSDHYHWDADNCVTVRIYVMAVPMFPIHVFWSYPTEEERKP